MARVRETGAMWVKGQLFYPDQAPEQFTQIALYERAKIDRFKQAAIEHDLIPLFTPMATDLVRFCDRHHLKIRHKDRNNLPLIRAAQAQAGTVWVSGLSRIAPKGIYRAENPRPVLCVPKYPATAEDYREAYEAPPEAPDHDRTEWDGISSHLGGSAGKLIKLCEELRIPKDGWIEAHVGFDRQDYEYPWSVPVEQFEELVKWGDSA